MDRENTENAARRQGAAAGREKRRGARYQMLVSFLLAWIAVFLVLNIMMVVRIAGLAAESRQIQENGVTTSQTA